MSLTFKEFAEVTLERKKVKERLEKLFGFDPAMSNHYGVIKLYNVRIDSSTPDEKLIELRQKFLRWNERVFSLFAENGVELDWEEYDSLCGFDFMYGGLFFLNVPLDIDGDFAPYRAAILSYLEKRKRQNEP